MSRGPVIHETYLDVTCLVHTYIMLRIESFSPTGLLHAPHFSIPIQNIEYKRLSGSSPCCPYYSMAILLWRFYLYPIAIVG
jgi:hypothetical protein